MIRRRMSCGCGCVRLLSVYDSQRLLCVTSLLAHLDVVWRGADKTRQLIEGVLEHLPMI